VQTRSPRAVLTAATAAQAAVSELAARSVAVAATLGARH